MATFAREWKVDFHMHNQTSGQGTFIPLSFEPRDAFQFDWSEDWAIISNERTKLQVTHTKLSYSRAFIVRAYLTQSHEMLFGTHHHAFQVLGGVPRRGIYDNMRTAIDKVGRSKERDVNIRFQVMASHYLFEPDFCHPAPGWEKGEIEKNVRISASVLSTSSTISSSNELNDWLEERFMFFWATTTHGKMRGSIADFWAEEVQTLMPVSRFFDSFVEYTKRVSPTCLVHFDHTRSVPASFANRPVSLRVYPDHAVVAAEGQIIRSIQASLIALTKHQVTLSHYLSVIQRKPGALRNSAPFTELPEALHTPASSFEEAGRR